MDEYDYDEQAQDQEQFKQEESMEVPTLHFDRANLDQELYDILQQASSYDQAAHVGMIHPMSGFGSFNAPEIGPLTPSLQPQQSYNNYQTQSNFQYQSLDTSSPLADTTVASGFYGGPTPPPALSVDASPVQMDQGMSTSAAAAAVVLPAEKPKRSYRKAPKKSGSILPTSLPSSAQRSSSAAAAKTAVKQETQDLDGPEDADRLAKRLARKAELARASRKRKKMYVHDLEVKVKQLGQKIEELQRKQTKGPVQSEEKERKEAQARVRQKLCDIVESKKQDETTLQQLNQLIRKFVENSRQRQAKVDFYMDRVDECLTPGLQVKFALWGMDQPDDFYTKPGLWSSLMYNEVGMTEEQMRMITSRREQIRQERRNLALCQKQLKDVRERITGQMASLNRQIDVLQSILTPVQLAKFYVWVEKNEWCMQMLDSMWSAPPENSQ